MNQTHLRTWIEALRSGEYKQGRNYLTKTHRLENEEKEKLHCCLGVATCLAIEAGVPIRVYEKYMADAEWWITTYDDVTDLLPSNVSEWLEIYSEDPYFKNPALIDSGVINVGDYREFGLAELNDSGFTFAQIADVLEYFFVEKEITDGNEFGAQG